MQNQNYKLRILLKRMYAVVISTINIVHVVKTSQDKVTLCYSIQIKGHNEFVSSLNITIP